MKILLYKLYFFIFQIIFGKISLARKLGVKIGDNCRIYIRDWGSEPFLINLGNNITIAPGVKFSTHDGSYWIFREKDKRYYRYGKISIGNNVFVGMNCIILPNVNIEDNVVVGAGSVITKDLECNNVYAGNPARKICTIDEFKIKMMKKGKCIENNIPFEKRVALCIKK